MLRPALSLTFLTLLASGLACGKAEVAGLAPPNKDVVRDGGDTTVRDAGNTTVRDAGPRDGGTGPLVDGAIQEDSGVVDPPDGGDIKDASTTDAEPADASDPGDGGTRDGGTPDGGTPDGGTPDGGVECVNDMQCRGLGPQDYCELGSNVCVECLNDTHCNFNGVCDTAHGFVCRPPCFNGFCAPGQTCDSTINVCVDCLTDNDCNGGERCHPATRECVECITNTDCALSPGQHVCDLSDNDCVGCASDTDCAMGEQCYDYQRNFCAPATGRTICTPCVVDNECGAAGDLCIGYNSAGGLFDRSCSPACVMDTDCPRGWDCVNVRQGSAQVCRPRYDMQTPTCTAERNLGEACRASPQNLDPGCGLGGVQDARCVQSTAGNAATCTFWCTTNDECPTGTTCTNVDANTRVCW